MTNNDPSIKYTVKEILARIDVKVDSIDNRLKDGDKKFSVLFTWNRIWFASFVIVFTVLGYLIF